jgi:hypothetical protein
MSLESRVGLGVKDETIAFWCFEVLDSLLGYGNESELKYATGESYLNWKKRGLILKHGKSKGDACSRMQK